MAGRAVSGVGRPRLFPGLIPVPERGEPGEKRPEGRELGGPIIGLESSAEDQQREGEA